MRSRGPIVVGVGGVVLLAAMTVLRLAPVPDEKPVTAKAPLFEKPVRIDYVEPEPVRLSEAPAPPDSASVADATRQAQITQLIEMVRTSAARGDAVMKEAAVGGLGKYGKEAEAALRVEYAREPNATARAALSEALGRMNP